MEPIWAPDEHLKMFLLTIRFRGDFREISDSTHANTARSQTLKIYEYL